MQWMAAVKERTDSFFILLFVYKKQGTLKELHMLKMSVETKKKARN